VTKGGHIELLQNVEIAVFDFDGTLVDSNGIKMKAFERTFLVFPDRLEEIMQYCRGFNHTPRDEKFRHVCETIIGQPYTAQLSAGLHDRFERATTSAIVNAPEIPGAREFVEQTRSCCETAILSSTPHAVLLDIVSKRGWTKLFDFSQGAPINKAAWLSDIRTDRALEPNQIVFFGDMPEDAVASRKAGCSFVAVANRDLISDSACYIPDYMGLT